MFNDAVLNDASIGPEAAPSRIAPWLLLGTCGARSNRTIDWRCVGNEPKSSNLVVNEPTPKAKGFARTWTRRFPSRNQGGGPGPGLIGSGKTSHDFPGAHTKEEALVRRPRMHDRMGDWMNRMEFLEPWRRIYAGPRVRSAHPVLHSRPAFACMAGSSESCTHSPEGNTPQIVPVTSTRRGLEAGPGKSAKSEAGPGTEVPAGPNLRPRVAICHDSETRRP